MKLFHFEQFCVKDGREKPAVSFVKRNADLKQTAWPKATPKII